MTRQARGSELPLQKNTSFYIDGDWVERPDAELIDVINPATEEVFGQIAAGTQADVDLAMAAARRAFDGFSRTLGRRADCAARTHSRPAGGSCRGVRAGDHAGDGFGDRLCARRAGALRHRTCPCRDRGARGFVLAGRDPRHHRAQGAGGGRLHDHSLELAALPDHRQGGPGHRGRVHDGPQAQRALPLHRAIVRAGDPRCPHPGRRLQYRARLGRDRRPRAGVAS